EAVDGGVVADPELHRIPPVRPWHPGRQLVTVDDDRYRLRSLRRARNRQLPGRSEGDRWYMPAQPEDRPGGSGRLGAGVALVPGDGYCLALGERRAGGERLVELARAEALADLGYQVGLYPP